MDLDIKYNSIVDDNFNDLANKDAEILKHLKAEYDSWVDPDESISLIHKSIDEIKNIFNKIRTIDRKSLTTFFSEAADRDLPKNKYVFVHVSESKRLQIIQKMGENLKNQIDVYKTKHP
jgi:hypothetical protein